MPTVPAASHSWAHGMNIKVLPWTVNDKETIKYFIDNAGVDGLITDYPKRGMEVLKELP